MKKQLIALGLTLFSLMTFAQREVSQERMADIYEEGRLLINTVLCLLRIIIIIKWIAPQYLGKGISGT